MPSEKYGVELTRQAQKDLVRLRGWTERATRELRVLQSDPNSGHPLKGSLRGARGLEFSLPGGEYRAVYVALEEEKVCLVFLIGPHEGVYEKAARRLDGLRRSGRVRI